MSARDLPRLIPHPRSIVVESTAPRVRLDRKQIAPLAAESDERDRFALHLLAATLRAYRAPSRTSSVPPAPIVFRPLSPLGPLRPPTHNNEAYTLSIASGAVTVGAASPRGRYYAIQTLRQLIIQYGGALPLLQIDDAPDYPNRGFLHDVSRGKVPRLRTLFQLVEWLGYLKYNHLQLYVEHPFAFAQHPLIGRGHSPLTPDDIRKLDAHCKLHCIELTPNLQSFGHAAHILEHSKYRHLAESDFRGGWTLSPAEPETYKLLEELYEEFLPNYSQGDRFNVDCDETWDLGKGKSAADARRRGVGRVYLDHIKKVRRLAARHGRRIMLWGDIIEKHPDLIGELPNDALLLHWNYDAHGEEKDYRKRLTPWRDSGREHWVCPGTSAWNSLFFRMTDARANLRQLARAGRWSGANGYLVTDWGDNGHYNFLSASLWPMAYGADCAWSVEPDRRVEREFDRRFVRLLLDDAREEWIDPLRALGDLYLVFGVRVANNSPERWLLAGPPDSGARHRIISPAVGEYAQISESNLISARRTAEAAALSLERIEPGDASIRSIRDEWRLAAEMSAHACRLELHRRGRGGGSARLRRECRHLAGRFEELWLRRNRRSDLDRNLQEIESALAPPD